VVMLVKEQDLKHGLNW